MTLLRYARELAKWRVFVPVSAALYRSVVNHLSRRRFIARGQKTTSPWSEPRRIVYYLRSFPTLSETFIQREIAALSRAGISVQVIAHKSEDEELLGREARELMERTSYLGPIGRVELARCAWSLSRRRPFVFIGLLLYVVSCRYDSRKSFALDLQVFARAVRLAVVLKAQEANHVHAPWASLDAFVALIAARLLNIPYTVQARAYDIHRHTSAVGLTVKLAGAAFVVTNSRYNESHLKSLLPVGSEHKVRAIYNGIDLSRFQPGKRRKRTSAAVKILSVANFVEPKGLEYLLMACRILRDRGYDLSCELIGGRVAAEINYYIDLKKLRKRLALEKEIVFAGRRPFDYVLEQYEQADVFVLPAVVAKHGGRDITPNVLIEAMAMKLPVVSTTSGAIPEIVEDGVSGILVPPRDEQALAQAIVRLFTNPALADELRTNARRKVEERFNVDKNISQLVDLFRDGISTPAVSRSQPAQESCLASANFIR